MSRIISVLLLGVLLAAVTCTATTDNDSSGDNDLPPIINVKTFFLFANNEDVQTIVQLLNSRGSHQHYFNIRLIRSMYCFGRKTEIRIETDDTQFFTSQSCWPSRPEVAWVNNALQQAYMSKVLWIRFQSYTQTRLADALQSDDELVLQSHCSLQEDDNSI